jgi:hypothetical protein
VFDIIPTVNNDYGSAAYIGFDDEILKKNNLKLDIIFISIINYQSAIFACSGGEIWKNKFSVFDDISPLIIYKKSGRPTGSDKDGLTEKDNYHLNSA